MAHAWSRLFASGSKIITIIINMYEDSNFIIAWRTKLSFEYCLYHQLWSRHMIADWFLVQQLSCPAGPFSTLEPPNNGHLVTYQPQPQLRLSFADGKSRL